MIIQQRALHRHSELPLAPFGFPLRLSRPDAAITYCRIGLHTVRSGGDPKPRNAAAHSPPPWPHLTVVMHLLGLSVLIAATNRHSTRLHTERHLVLQMLVLVGVSFGLFILHSVEIWSYAALYRWVGAIPLVRRCALLLDCNLCDHRLWRSDVVEELASSWGRSRAPTASSCWGGRLRSLSPLSRGFAPSSMIGRAPRRATIPRTGQAIRPALVRESAQDLAVIPHFNRADSSGRLGFRNEGECVRAKRWRHGRGNGEVVWIRGVAPAPHGNRPRLRVGRDGKRCRS